jgi:hypothetical protein
LLLAGCPMESAANVASEDAGGSVTADADAPSSSDAGTGSVLAPTHTGLVSIQDIAIANLPAAGHGLTVNAFFTPLVAPDFIEDAGQLTGCRAWSYDVTTKPAPPEQDHGELHIQGTKNNDGVLTCRFVPQRGYLCPTAVGSAMVAVGSPSGADVAITLAGATFATSDVGRYLQLSGAGSSTNNGAFAIVGVTSPTEVVVANPRATAETFAGSFTVLAGAGPTPNNLYDPFIAGTKVTIGLAPGAGAGSAFEHPTSCAKKRNKEAKRPSATSLHRDDHERSGRV